jgi:hypothetical protein
MTEGQGAHTGERTSGKAIASLVFSILGSGIFSIVGLILGYQAKREIDESGGRITGRGLALAGIIIGWIGLALAVLGIVLIIVGAAAAD